MWCFNPALTLTLTSGEGQRADRHALLSPFNSANARRAKYLHVVSRLFKVERRARRRRNTSGLTRTRPLVAEPPSPADKLLFWAWWRAGPGGSGWASGTGGCADEAVFVKGDECV